MRKSYNMCPSDNKLILPPGVKRELQICTFFEFVLWYIWFFYIKLLNIKFNTI